MYPFWMPSLLREISALRSLHLTTRLTYRSTSFARLEKQMNLLISEVRAGKREGSIISEENFDAKAQSDQVTWDILRRELKDIGVTAEVLVEKRAFIVGWFQKAVAAGWLEEDVSPASDDEDSINEGAFPSTPTEYLHSGLSTISMAPQDAQGVRNLRATTTSSPSRSSDVNITSAEEIRFSISDHNAESIEQSVQNQTPITRALAHEPPVDFNDRSIRNSVSCHDTGIGNEVDQTSATSAGANCPKLERQSRKDRLGIVLLAFSHLPRGIGTAFYDEGRKSDEKNATIADDAEAADKKLLRYFLAKGADPVAIDTCDKTALDHAAKWGKINNTGVLLDGRQDPFIIARSSLKRAPEMYAVVAVLWWTALLSRGYQIV